MKKSAKDFVNRLQTDEDFRKRLASFTEDQKGAFRAEVQKEYDFALDDLTAALDAAKVPVPTAAVAGELSDEQLDGVAGGTMSDITWQKTAASAVGGAGVGAAMGWWNPLGSVATGAALGGGGAVVGYIAMNALDSLFKWKW